MEAQVVAIESSLDFVFLVNERGFNSVMAAVLTQTQTTYRKNLSVVCLYYKAEIRPIG